MRERVRFAVGCDSTVDKLMEYAARPNSKLKALARKLAEVCWDGGTLDGGELQDLLIEAGVLIDVVAMTPCGENCRCREYGVEPPWVCYRLAEAFK
jgi:hypothetical protein